MLDEKIVRHCSPTLAGLKTANMFASDFDSMEEMHEALRRVNRTLAPKGVRALPLRTTNGNTLIYIFRPERLRLDMQDEIAKGILSRYGYGGMSISGCIARLSERITAGNGFPHEVGLFLGYPSCDVECFIREKNGEDVCADCVGCWKVYNDVDGCQKTFNQFRKCTRLYLEQLEKGSSIEKLTVRELGAS